MCQFGARAKQTSCPICSDKFTPQRTQTGLCHKQGRQVSAKNKGILLKGGGILTSKDIMDKIKARDNEKKAKEEAKM